MRHTAWKNDKIVELTPEQAEEKAILWNELSVAICTKNYENEIVATENLREWYIINGLDVPLDCKFIRTNNVDYSNEKNYLYNN